MADTRDEALFKDLLANHTGTILKVARSFTSTQEDMNDLSQEILIQLWLAIPSYQERSKPSTWIYRVALNKALTWQRSEKKRWARYSPLSEIVDARISESNEKHEILGQLYREIRKLNKINRSLILLYLDGFSYSEMAETLGMSQNSVGVRLNRIRKQLSENMKGGSHEL